MSRSLSTTVVAGSHGAFPETESASEFEFEFAPLAPLASSGAFVAGPFALFATALFAVSATATPMPTAAITSTKTATMIQIFRLCFSTSS
jgi:hypothetical protein